MTSTLASPTRTSEADLDLELLGPGFGAVVHGVDLLDADDPTVAAVRRALTDHKVAEEVAKEWLGANGQKVQQWLA